MGTGIADTVSCKVMWEKMIFFRILKCKLKNLHARETELIPKLNNGMIDLTQILCYNWQIVAQSRLQCCKEVNARSLFPFAVYCSIISVRNGPLFIEATEVVDAQEVCQSQLIADPVNPPLITGLCMILPVVQRISP